MRIKAAIERIPAGMMIVPLILGALLNTIDQARFAPLQELLFAMGAVPSRHAALPPQQLADGATAPAVATLTADRLPHVRSGVVIVDGREQTIAQWKAAAATATGAVPPPSAAITVQVRQPELPVYEFLRVGGNPEHKVGSFTESLFKTGALCLIALFLLCSAAQMDLRMGARALGKGAVLTGTKFAVGVGAGVLVGHLFGPMQGFLGLSTVTIIAAMTNGNGGMYAALTAQYGNRSDVGALSVLSLNDGPFLTMVALGLLGTAFPMVVFAGVLIPIMLGMVLGNLDPEMRTFLAPGEKLLIPFFAFALGAGMNLATFADPRYVVGGVVLGAATTVLTGAGMWLAFWILRIRSRIAAFAEASVAGNATATPLAVAAAAAAAGSADAAALKANVDLATGQIGIAVLTTAILCPIAVMLIDRFQRRRGVIGTDEAA